MVLFISNLINMIVDEVWINSVFVATLCFLKCWQSVWEQQVEALVL